MFRVGGGVSGNQFPTFDAEFKFAKIQNPHVQGGWGGLVETNFQLLMLSSNLLKSKIPMFRVGGVVGGNQFPTFDAEFKFAKIQNPHVQGGWGGGLVETNFQLFMLSSNLLKSKIPMFRVGGVVGGNQFPTFDAEFKFAKIQNPHVQGGGGGVGGNQFPTFHAEFKFAKIQNSHVQGRGGWLVETNFQLLMLSSNLLKSKIPMFRVGGGVSGNQFPTFDAEFKFAKIQNPHVQGGWGGLVETNFQLLMLSSNLLKSQIPMLRVQGGVSRNQFPTFDAEFKFAKIQNPHVQGGWGG